MHVLIAGCGWLGQAVARRLLERGDRVTGLRSDPERAGALRGLGIAPLALDLADPNSATRLPSDLDAILALQAARGGGEAAYRCAYLEANRTLLTFAQGRGLQAFVYSGSTGLFGQQDGSEVREDTPAQPASPTGQILAEAEAMLRDAAGRGIPTRIVRLSGLYGPGRLWMIDRVRQGRLGLGPGDEAWLNSCHRDDAVDTLLAALDRGRDGATYHATDEEPLRRRELVRFIADRLGILPALEAAPAPPGPNRRILGAATRAELGLRCRWPSLREGLRPFLEHHEGPSTDEHR